MRLLLVVPLLALALAPLAMPTALPAAAPPALPDCELEAIRLVPELEASAAPCPGIRPGAATVLYLGPEWFFPLQAELVLCSMGFIVTDGTDLYVSIAGHCVVDANGVAVPGTRVEASGIGKFGEVAYAWCEGRVSNAPCSLGRDFGLIKVDADKRHLVRTDMCGWGAPTGGLYDDATFVADNANPALGQHFGWGTGIATTAGVTQVNGIPVHAQPAIFPAQGRAGIVRAMTEASGTVSSVASPGDSGSALMILRADSPAGLADAQPEALGILTHIGGGSTFFQRLDVSLAKASADMGKEFTLVTEL